MRIACPSCGTVKGVEETCQRCGCPGETARLERLGVKVDPAESRYASLGLAADAITRAEQSMTQAANETSRAKSAHVKEAARVLKALGRLAYKLRAEKGHADEHRREWNAQNAR